jgi:hypothetical protein
MMAKNLVVRGEASYSAPRAPLDISILLDV